MGVWPETSIFSIKVDNLLICAANFQDKFGTYLAVFCIPSQIRSGSQGEAPNLSCGPDARVLRYRRRRSFWLLRLSCLSPRCLLRPFVFVERPLPGLEHEQLEQARRHGSVTRFPLLPRAKRSPDGFRCFRLGQVRSDAGPANNTGCWILRLFRVGHGGGRQEPAHARVLSGSIRSMSVFQGSPHKWEPTVQRGRVPCGQARLRNGAPACHFPLTKRKYVALLIMRIINL